jgi:hypothetical protein
MLLDTFCIHRCSAIHAKFILAFKKNEETHRDVILESDELKKVIQKNGKNSGIGLSVDKVKEPKT